MIGGFLCSTVWKQQIPMRYATPLCKKAVESAREHCLRGMPNTGLTYSNLAGRKSVVAVSRTTTEYEFVNTVTHEMFHVVTHICESLGIDLKDEEPCYMMGWLCQAVSRIFI